MRAGFFKKVWNGVKKVTSKVADTTKTIFTDKYTLQVLAVAVIAIGAGVVCATTGATGVGLAACYATAIATDVLASYQIAASCRSDPNSICNRGSNAFPETQQTRGYQVVCSDPAVCATLTCRADEVIVNGQCTVPPVCDPVTCPG